MTDNRLSQRRDLTIKQKILLLPVVLLLFILPTYCGQSSLGQEPAEITLDPSTTYQTITGWEATDFNGNIDLPEFGVYGFNPPVLGLYKNVLADEAVNDLGLDRVRLEIFSGDENSADYYTPYINGQIPRSTWRDHRNEIINDNDDPNVINPSGFHFAFLDYKIDTVVLPMKKQLEAKGESLYINLNYVDFGSSSFEHKDHPEEYAEFMLAAFLHLQSKYGWVPDAVEIILEPNNADWSGTQIGNALVATAQRLQDNGFNPEFIAPSDSDLGSALNTFDEMVSNVPEVLSYITEFSYHCYGGCNDANLKAAASRGAQYGINTSHLEHIGHSYLDLHRDLTLANVSAWAQYTLAGPYPGDGGGDYYFVDISDLDNPIVSMQSRTKFLRQYIKFVKKGAIRIEADSNNGNFDPVAFINSDGTYVVVVKADGAGEITIQGLPAGTYGIKYTTSNEYDKDRPDLTIGSGQVLNTGIPAAGAITVYKTDSSPPPTVTPTATPLPPEFSETVYLPNVNKSLSGNQVSEKLNSSCKKNR